MYVMTSLSRMFARIVVLTFVASNERQARLFTPRGCCPNVQVHARVLLLTFRSDFQRPFEFEDSRNVFKDRCIYCTSSSEASKNCSFPLLTKSSPPHKTTCAHIFAFKCDLHSYTLTVTARDLPLFTLTLASLTSPQMMSMLSRIYPRHIAYTMSKLNGSNNWNVINHRGRIPVGVQMVVCL